MRTWFTSRRTPRPATPCSPLRERLEDRVLFDGVPDAPLVTPDQPVDDPLAPATESTPSAETVTHDVASSADTAPRTELVFVDKRVGNYQDLVADLLREGTAEVYFLDRTTDGLAQIEDALAGRSDVDALHILSHGDPGQLRLGSTLLTQESMQGAYAEQLRQIGGHLGGDADILIYGCNFAHGRDGAAAAQTLATLTGADVAASTDDTGHESLGGNWILELQVGRLETEIAIGSARQLSWGGLLAEPIAAFLISDATDQVIKLTDRTNTSTAVVVGPMTNTFNVEALVRDTTTGHIYASDANRLGIVDLENGTVVVVGNYGTVNGNALDQVISLTVHPQPASGLARGVDDQDIALSAPGDVGRH